MGYRGYQGKPNFLNFKHSTFEGREADLTDLIRQYAPTDLLHQHLVVDSRNQVLAEYAKEIIENSNFRTIIFTPNNPPKPSEQEIDQIYLLKPNELVVSIDKLPLRYLPFDKATEGGLPLDQRLIFPYETLKEELVNQLKGVTYTGVDELWNDPSIFYAVKVIGNWRNNQDWQTKLKNRFLGRGDLPDSLNYIFTEICQGVGISEQKFKLFYPTEANNVLQVGYEYRSNFNFQRYIDLVIMLGGWVDFKPGRPKNYKLINYTYFPDVNFTTWNSNGRLMGIIQNINWVFTPRHKITAHQQKFMLDVSHAFGVNL